MRVVAVLSFLACAASAQTVPVLSQPQIEQLEATVAQNPNDLQSQKLLGQNYALFILGITSLDQYNSVTSVDRARADSDFAQHARDAMKNSPLPTVVGEGGHALWNFSYASAFGLQTWPLDARALGSASLDRAIGLDPGNQTWRTYRIPVTVLRTRFDFMRLSVPAGYALVQEDMAVLTGSNRFYQLADAAKLAVLASALDDAESYAAELLRLATDPRDWNYGNAIFAGNMVLGQVALRRGNLADAQSKLLASGRTPGSPQLDSFGPNMSLALDLLTHGDAATASERPVPGKARPHAAPASVRDTVLQFFDLCGVFWTFGAGNLQRWSDQVRRGLVPNFGANLDY